MNEPGPALRDEAIEHRRSIEFFWNSELKAKNARHPGKSRDPLYNHSSKNFIAKVLNSSNMKKIVNYFY